MKASIPFDIIKEGGMYKVQLGKGVGLAIDLEIKDIARSIGGNVYSEGGYSFGSFDNRSTAETFANRVREELDKRDGIRIDRKVYDALLLKLRNMNINVSNDTDLMRRILNEVSPSDIKLLPIDRDSEEYGKMVSDATVRIENRLAELRRSMAEEQSLKSDNTETQPTSLSMEGLSPHDSGAQSAASSSANINIKFVSTKYLKEKLSNFILNQGNLSLDSKGFPKSLMKALGLVPNEHYSQYIHFISDSGYKYVLRVSDHENIPASTLKRHARTDHGVSLIIRTEKSKQGNPQSNKYSNVKEYVYKKPSQEQLSKIVKSIFGLFEFGNYIDIANADHVNVSPKPLGFQEGQYFGFVHDNTIYIDPTRVNAETPIHEYAHLWAEALRQKNPKEWKNIVSIMKEDKALWSYVKSSYAHLQADNDIADEVLATYSGRQGLERLKEASKQYDNPKSMFDHISRMLVGFWKAVCGFVGIEYKNKEDIADRILYDLLTEVNPLEYTKDGVQKLSDRMILGQKNIEQAEFSDAKTCLMGVLDSARNDLGDTICIKPTPVKLAGLVYTATGVYLAPDGEGSGEYRLLGRDSVTLAIEKGGRTEFSIDKILDTVSSVNRLAKAVRDTQINILSKEAKQAIHNRIVTPSARSFNSDQVTTLNRYHQMAAPDTPAGEVFSRLLDEVAQYPDVVRKPEKWVIDTAKELDGLAEGITREESRELHL